MRVRARSLECIARRDCTSLTAKACCLHGGIFNKDSASALTCNADEISVTTSDTHSQESCGNELVRMCTSTADCELGERCKPFQVKPDEPSILKGQILGICVK